jgi:hypothetical protein
MMGRVMMGTVPLTALLPATPAIAGFSSVVTASSSTGNLLLTAAASNLLNFYKGIPVTFKNSGGFLMPGVTANNVYYASPQTVSTFLISTSFANAQAGVYLAYGGTGTGTQTVYGDLTLSLTGEYSHTQLLSELVSHVHPPLAPATNFVTTGTGAANTTGGSNIGTSATTGNNGGGQAFNVIQPGVFYNMFIKL